MTDTNQKLREQLKSLLGARQAHVDPETVIEKLSFENAGKKPEGAPWTIWELFEHMRIAQWDILEFTRDPEHESPEFPKGYWPQQPAPESKDVWEESVASFRRDLEDMQSLVGDARTDLFEKLPHGTGQTALREAMLVADHNAYHLGQIVLMMKQLNLW